MMPRLLVSCISPIVGLCVAVAPSGVLASAAPAAPDEVAAPEQPGPSTPAVVTAPERPGPPTPAVVTTSERPGPPTPAVVTASERPGPPTPAEAPVAELPAPRATDDETAPGAAGTAGVVVHVVNELPSEEVGPLKLVRHRGTTTARGGNVIVYTTTYDELCTEPCGVPIDVTERPILFFVRDGNAVTDGFRLDDDEPEVTLSVRPVRRSMVLGGGALLSVLLVPVGVPLLILGRGRVFYGAGAPSPTQELRRVKQARP